MSDDAPEALGDYIRASREVAKLSLRELARRVGMSHVYLGRIENGERSKLAPEILQRIVEVLDLDPAEAFAHIGVKPAALMPTRKDFFRSAYGVDDAEADEIIGMLNEYMKKHKKEGDNDNTNQEDHN